jgi:ferric-dicitrate binding protein FerR (iron transport regulator)
VVRDIYAATNANAARWREGLLEYIDEPAPNIIADLGRYSDRQIVIRDSRLEQLRLGGQFNVRRGVRHALSELETFAPVTVDENEGKFTLDYLAKPTKGRN